MNEERATTAAGPEPEPSLTAQVTEMRRYIDALRKEMAGLRRDMAQLQEQTTIPYIDRALAERARGRS